MGDRPDYKLIVDENGMETAYSIWASQSGLHLTLFISKRQKGRGYFWRVIEKLKIPRNVEM